jgi:O-antigen chain-terminating methyltransferase
MTDLDTLVARLRAAAADHASTQLPGQVTVRSWPPVAGGGARRALRDAWASARSTDLRPFLVSDPEDFVELAFLSCLGRPADPGGRGHYLGRLQQGTPRLEVLAQLAGSPESLAYRGAPAWPLWLRPLLWSLRLPAAGARRATRGVLRRIERRMGRRARGDAPGLVWRLAAQVDDQDRLRQAERDSLSQDAATTRQRLVAAESAVADLSAQLAALEAVVERTSRALSESTDTALKGIAAMRARLATIEHHAPVPAAAAAPQASAPTAAPEADAEVARYYLTLESVFRGDPARIRAQLEADYLAPLAEARAEAGDGPCVDLGCGRGEWLDVLRAHGYAARGVDLNATMAAEARAAGHDVTHADALSFLRGLADDSVLAVSAFHLAEHLDFATLYRLVAECRRVLKPNGRLILETPNPENLWVATHTFHHDPTHGNPLTPSSLEFLVNHHGLETVAVLRLHPYPEAARLPGNDPATERLNAMTCGPQDFAVVAKKTAAA